jgi:hypothetical protein
MLNIFERPWMLRFIQNRRLGPWSSLWHFLPPSLTPSLVCASV